MDAPQKTDIAVPMHFECRTLEECDSFPKLIIEAVIVLGRGKIDTIDIDELKEYMCVAVKDTVTFIPAKKGPGND